MIESKYLSEADFVCHFLSKKINEFAVSNNLDLEIHIEEPVNIEEPLDVEDKVEFNKADLTMRLNSQKLCVFEAKLNDDPYLYDVVKQGYRYAAYGFPFFVTCNPDLMILFTSEVDPPNNALSIIRYDEAWVKSLLDLTSNPKSPKELYSLLKEQGIIDSDTAEFFRDTWIFRSQEETTGIFTEPTVRTIAVSGTSNRTYPWNSGSFWDIKDAKIEKERLEKLGFKIKIQNKKDGRWIDYDDAQTTLDDT